MFLSQEIVIDKNTGEVFDYTHAVENLTGWYTFVTAAEHIEGDAVWPAQGGKIKTHFEVAGQKFEAECVAMTSRPGEEMIFSVEGKLFKGTQHWSYTDQDGSTLVNAKLDFRFPFGVFDNAFYQLGMKQATFQLQKSLYNLKLAIEGH